MKGCPLKCVWCSNPESQNSAKEILHIKQNCIGCRRCVRACPTGLINNDVACENSTQCEICANACPSNARRVSGRMMSIESILEEVEKDRLYYRRSDGGMTVGGGEPMMQHEFVSALFRECQRLSIPTAVETSGFAQWTSIQEVLKSVDLVYFDLKHMNSGKHVAYTGVPNELILENAKRIVSNHICDIVIRIPVIPGYNDSHENMKNTAEFAVSLGSIKEVELLGYHRFGERKYEWLKRPYELKGILPPSQDHLTELARIFTENGLEVRTTR